MFPHSIRYVPDQGAFAPLPSALCEVPRWMPDLEGNSAGTASFIFLHRPFLSLGMI
jgi:hypothetical protein